jgi:LPS-assembly protein
LGGIAGFARRAVTLRFAPLVATLLLALAKLNAAQPVLPELTAEETLVTEQESLFRGDARLAQGDVVLRADEISLDNRTLVATARGNVVLTRGAQRLVADEISYRVNDRSWEVGRFRLGEGQLLAAGDAARGDAAGATIEGASLTYGEPDPLSPVLRARAVRYEKAPDPRDDVARLEGARLGVGEVELLPLPRLAETPRNPSFADLDVRAGYDNNLGAELSVAGATAVTDSLRLGADLGLFSKRGLLFGPIGDYDYPGAGGLGARGEFRSGFIQDQGNPGEDIRGDSIRDERAYLEWRHRQELTDTAHVAGQIHYWSDSFITRDFRSEGYFGLQTPDTWFEAEKLGGNYVVSLFTRVQVNDWALVQERLPELRFDGLPVELGAGVYHRLNASVAALREDDPLAATGSIRSDRADLYYGAMRPFTPREWLAVTPTVGARVTHYERTPAGSARGNYTRVLAEAGFDAELLRFSGAWDYRNKRWDIDGLRHLVTPKLAYRFSPSADVGQGSIPAIDDDPFNTYLRPLGLADRRDIDRLPALNTFRIGLDQKLQTRHPTHGSRDLAQLELAIDQHADPEAARDARLSTLGPDGRRDRGDLHAFFALSPAPWLRFDSFSRQTLQTGKLQELNTGLTLRDAEVWSFRIGTHYLEDLAPRRQIQEYTTTFGLRLNEIYSLIARLRLDSRSGEVTEQSLTVAQRLSRFWTASYEFSAYDGTRREGDYGVSVRLETAGF